MRRVFLLGLFLLLIIPGIIFMIYWIFGSYVFLDEDKGILYSLKKSRQLVKGNWWKMFGYLILIMIILFIFAILIGIILALPILFSGNSIVYIAFDGISNLIVSLAFYGFLTLFFKNIYLEWKGKSKTDKKKKK